MSKNKIFLKVFLGFLFCFGLSVIVYAESCYSVGQVQYKYTASGCSYTTQSRTCCGNGSWSAFGGSCPTAPSPVYSTVSMKLDCTGTSYIYVSFGNGMSSDRYPPSYNIPYPKCAASNICSGKSFGYICYERYTSADSQCWEYDHCNYWTESGTTDQSEECFWGGQADVTINIITCK